MEKELEGDRKKVITIITDNEKERDQKGSFIRGVSKGKNFKDKYKGKSFRSKSLKSVYQESIASDLKRQLCKECHKYHQRQCLKGEDICFHCRKPEHFVKDCPFLNSRQ